MVLNIFLDYQKLLEFALSVSPNYIYDLLLIFEFLKDIVD